MSEFRQLLEKKNNRLNTVPAALQTVVEQQQQKVLNKIIAQINSLETEGGKIVINSANIDKISEISDELKTVFLNDEYKAAVKKFASEFKIQSVLNAEVITAGIGDVAGLKAANTFIETAKRSAIESLVGSPIDKEFIKPIQSILETAVVNNARFDDTIETITTFVKGNKNVDGKILQYVKQISNDSFAVADRSFTGIVSDALEAEWFYYSGTELSSTRCFCAERVGHFFYYKEIEAWGDGQDLGDCNIGGGKWAGEMGGTNSSTIYTNLGGYNCKHSLMPVSIKIVPIFDINRAKAKGYYEEAA